MQERGLKNVSLHKSNMPQYWSLEVEVLITCQFLHPHFHQHANNHTSIEIDANNVLYKHFFNINTKHVFLMVHDVASKINHIVFLIANHLGHNNKKNTKNLSYLCKLLFFLVVNHIFIHLDDHKVCNINELGWRFMLRRNDLSYQMSDYT